MLFYSKQSNICFRLLESCFLFYTLFWKRSIDYERQMIPLFPVFLIFHRMHDILSNFWHVAMWKLYSIAAFPTPYLVFYGCCKDIKHYIAEFRVHGFIVNNDIMQQQLMQLTGKNNRIAGGRYITHTNSHSGLFVFLLFQMFDSNNKKSYIFYH